MVDGRHGDTGVAELPEVKIDVLVFGDTVAGARDDGRDAGGLHLGRVDAPLPLGDVGDLDRGRQRWGGGSGRNGRRFGGRLGDGGERPAVDEQVVADAPMAAEVDGEIEDAAGMIDDGLHVVAPAGRQVAPVGDDPVGDLDHDLRVMGFDGVILALVGLVPAVAVAPDGRLENVAAGGQVEQLLQPCPERPVGGEHLVGPRAVPQKVVLLVGREGVLVDALAQ